MPHPAPHARRALRLAAITGAAAAGLLGLSGSAFAASSTVDASGTLTITDDPGHASVISVAELANPLKLSLLNRVMIDSDAPLQAPAGCTHPNLLILSDPSALLCDRDVVKSLVLDLGDGDDVVKRPLSSLSVLGAQLLPLGGLSVSIDGGAGNDDLQGGDGNDTIVGGLGADRLFGFGGDDALVGGLGEDYLEPGSGANIIDVSTPELDTVSLTVGSANRATASKNDVFVNLDSNTILDLVGLDLQVGGQPDPSGSIASIDVKADAGMPTVTDLLGGVAKALPQALPGGKAPSGVTLPLQPVIDSITGIAGKVKADLKIKADLLGLPLGMNLDDTGLHITIACDSECEILGNGVIDTGDTGVIPMTPDTIKAEGTGATRLNLGLGREYTKLERSLKAGKCSVVVSRLRVRSKGGSEVISYALPICGAKVTSKVAKRPVVTNTKATRRLVTTTSCSAACSLSPRFLLVKSGNKTLARVAGAKIKPLRGSDRKYTTTWKLTETQEAAITRGHRGSFKNVRYIVSAKATSGGVTTTGSTSFRTRGK